MADVNLVPLEVLLGHPERAAPQISPDGTRLSYIAPLDGVLNVFVGYVGADDQQPVTHDTERGIQGYLWAHDNRHLLYVRDKDGSENFRLYDVDLETGAERDLTPMDGVQCRLIAHRKRFPNDVLVGINKDNPQLHDVYHLDLTTGALRKVVENPGYLGWVVDDDLVVRGAVTPTPDGGMVILVRDDASADWRAAARSRARGRRVDGAARIHEGRHWHVPADVRRLEHRAGGETRHRDGCRRGDSRGSHVRHHRGDHAPGHATRSRVSSCTEIAWNIRSSTIQFAGTSKRSSGSTRAI